MSYNLLPGKTVIITGAATGIGRATAIGQYSPRPFLCFVLTLYKAAARNGANVVIHHLGAPTDAEAISLQEELTKLGAKSLVVEGDISDPATSAMVSLAKLALSSLPPKPLICSPVCLTDR